MQLYAVNFIPPLGSLYMFWVFYTPIIRSIICFVHFLTVGAIYDGKDCTCFFVITVKRRCMLQNGLS